MNSIDPQPILEKLNNYYKNYDDINNNIKKDENETNESFENSNFEDSQELGNFNEGHFFMWVRNWKIDYKLKIIILIN